MAVPDTVGAQVYPGPFLGVLPLPRNPAFFRARKKGPTPIVRVQFVRQWAGAAGLKMDDLRMPVHRPQETPVWLGVSEIGGLVSVACRTIFMFILVAPFRRRFRTAMFFRPGK